MIGRGAGALVVSAALLASAGSARAAAATSPRLIEWVRQAFERSTGGTLEIGSAELDVGGLRAEVKDLTLTIPAEGAPPLRVVVPSGTVSMDWTSLLPAVGGRVSLAEVVLHDPQVWVSARFVQHYRPPERAERRPVEVSVERLSVTGGAVHYEDPDLGVGIEAKDLSGSGAWSPARATLVGSLAASGEVTTRAFERPLPVRVRSGFRFRRGRLDLVGAEGEFPGGHATFDLGLSYGGGAVLGGEGHARADLAAIHEYLAARHLALSGVLEGAFRVDRVGGPVRLTGRVSGGPLRVGPVAADRAGGAFEVRSGVLSVTGLEASAYGGTVRGSVAVDFHGRTRLETDVEGEGLDLERLLTIPGITMPVATRTRGHFTVEGEAADPSTWTGGATIQGAAAPGEGGRLPADAEGRLEFANAAFRLGPCRVRMAAADFELGIDAPLGRKPVRASIRIDGETHDAAATQAGVLRLLDAFHVAEADILKRPLRGEGAIRSRIALGAAADLDVDLDLKSGAWDGEPFDEAAVSIGLRGQEVDLPRVRIRRGEGAVDAAATLHVEPLALDRLSGTVTSFPVEALLAWAGLRADVSGLAGGEAHAAREGGRLLGGGRFRVESGRAFGEILDRATSPFTLDGGRIDASEMDASGPAFEARGRALLDLETGETQIALARAVVHAAKLERARGVEVPIGGEVQLSGPVVWRKSGFEGELRMAVSGLKAPLGGLMLDQSMVGEVTGALTLHPDAVDLRLAGSAQGGFALQARVALQEGWPATASLRFGALEIGSESERGSSMSMQVGGEVRFDGSLSAPRSGRLEAELPKAVLRLGTKEVTAVEPLRVHLRDGRFRVDPVRFRGEAASLSAEADYRLADGTTSGHITGNLDLGLAELFLSGVRASGPVDADLEWSGTAEQPNVRGTVRVREGRARLADPPLAIEGLRFTAEIEGSRVTIRRALAYSGGGELRGEGEGRLGGGGLETYRAAIEVANVRFDFPAGFKGTYDGRIELRGDASGGAVTGRLDLLRGLYDQEFDLLSVAVGAGKNAGPAEASPLPRNVSLNVDIGAPGNVWVRNNVARLESGLALNVGGDLSRPQVTGRIWLIEGGRIRFQEVDYRIVSGSLDLTERDRIDPYFDIRATTTVQQYDINLHLEGTLGKFEYDLTSNPALATQDIVTLLVTGTIAEQAGAATGVGAGADAASTYFAGLLTGRVGSQLRRNLGLDRFEISPLLVQGTTDPSTRISVGKEVVPDVTIIYSTQIGGESRQTYQLEWLATHKIRVWGQQDTRTGLSGELQYTTRLGRKAVLAPSAARTPGANAPPEAERRKAVSVTITGVPPDEAAKLAAELPFKAGGTFTRAQLLEGAETLRRRFVREGRLDAAVTWIVDRVDEAPDARTITYAVDPGPVVEVDVQGLGFRDGRRIRKALDAFWPESAFSGDRYLEAQGLILRDLQSRGHYAADVTHDVSTHDGKKVVTFRVDRGKPVRVRSVEIEGGESIPATEVLKVVSLQQGKPKTRLLVPSKLQADRVAVRALYRVQGYAKVTVDPPEIRLTADGTAADVILRVDEGVRYTVGSVALPDGLAVPRESLESWFGIRPGDVYSALAVVAGENALRNRLDAEGYPEARVEARTTLGEDVAQVAVDVSPGPAMRVGTVTLEGNERTREKVIRRELEIAPGDRLTREKLLKSQRQLYRLGLFEEVKLDYEPEGGADPAAQRVRVRLREAPPLALSTGLGYDAEGSPRGSFAVTHDNVGGYDRNLAFQAVASKFLQRVQIVGLDPRFGGRRETEALASVFDEREVRTGYTSDRLATSVRLQKKPKDRSLTRWIAYTYQRVDLSDVTDPQAVAEQKLENLRLGNVGAGVVRDRRDDPFLPTHGGFAQLNLALFSPFLLSDESFVKTYFQSSFTHTFDGGTAVAVALRLGLAWTYGKTTEVPLSERFYAGGSNSMRGFPRDYVGPISDAGLPLGGNALFVLNQEFRVPIWKVLRGVGFCDLGNVYPTVQTFGDGGLRKTAGVGVRLDLPIGPLRLEYGWKLDPLPGESSGEWVFAIGSLY